MVPPDEVCDDDESEDSLDSSPCDEELSEDVEVSEDAEDISEDDGSEELSVAPDSSEEPDGLSLDGKEEGREDDGIFP